MPSRKPVPHDADAIAARVAHNAEYHAAPVAAIFAAAPIATVIDSTPKTLEAWRAVGRGPKFIRVGRAIRYRKADVEAWLAGQGGHQPAPPPAPTPARRVAAKPAKKGVRA